jgi:hypothetical protein
MKKTVILGALCIFLSACMHGYDKGFGMCEHRVRSSECPLPQPQP